MHIYFIDGRNDFAVLVFKYYIFGTVLHSG